VVRFQRCRLVASEALDVFDQQVKMESVRWRRNESKMLIEPAGAFVRGVDPEGADAGDVGGVECPQHRMSIAALNDARFLEQAAEAGDFTGRGVERFHERLPISMVARHQSESCCRGSSIPERAAAT
jgi:hypothetical protein